MTYPNTWQLDDLYPGGVEGSAFKESLEAAKIEKELLSKKVKAFEAKGEAADQALYQLIQDLEGLEEELVTLDSFAQMAADTDIQAEVPVLALDRVGQLLESFDGLALNFDQKLLAWSEEEWQDLLASPVLAPYRFHLEERRREASQALDPKTERLLLALDRDGIEAWSQTYDSLVACLHIQPEGSKTTYSVGQAMNHMLDDPDPKKRAAFFKAWEAAFTEMGPVFARILNHLAGYRMTEQKAHGDDFLEEPLRQNRMTYHTLGAMWEAVDAARPDLLQFLKTKQKLLQLDKLNWQDIAAPLTLSDSQVQRYTWEEACQFVVDHFRKTSEEMADFADQALKAGWVEAEDRPGKRPGGYCTEPLANGESRIFMTFTGSAQDVSTLAHELGHAFHSYVMRDLSTWQQGYAMNVAETASTLAENLIASSQLAEAKDPGQRLQLLNAKLENTTAMFMDIRARYLFEKTFYSERQAGYVGEERLNQLMVSAQREAFAGALDSYHPHFWASKLHFFISDVPFYNFPYSFGYLFSQGILAELMKDPDHFTERYVALLRDTAVMTVEDLAAKHLGVDLTQIDFWQEGVALALQDVRAFVHEGQAYLENNQ
ncbi:M3 family oligoendopeptidase [Aerococcus sanguinicola]|uniref:M3 family oligoendopeptidase n=1 Tax=Aerococcus sanguinicola TaxID=119206 RepID=UPI0018A743AF|nr:M3 family oligoendopeptidase [Aerococcus sanguinicola]